ncbi:PX domain [Popillia japonica]|uniref:PX domain n=1 Tax=Popillia japonica TaxID=7064 RepID=A0AAW1JUB0_POPJA
MGEIQEEYKQLNELKNELLIKLKNTCQFIMSHCNEFSFPDSHTKRVFQVSHCNEFSFPDSHTKRVFQDLVVKSESNTPLSDTDSDYLVDLLNGIKGQSVIQDLVHQHRRELAELQAELERRVQTLSERRTAVEKLDKRLVDLVDEQLQLGVPSSSENLQHLKVSLASRTEQQMYELEQRKQALTLNLKKINTAQNPSSCPVTNTSSAEGATLSSDTYHTATSSCSTHLKMDAVEQFMSDSGVELRPNNAHDESDISSTESHDCKCVTSDSHSSSSVEDKSPIIRKRRRDSEALRKISQKIIQQKQLIMKNLDSHASKSQIDGQIAILQDLQKQYMALKAGSLSALLPAAEHPLQSVDSPSPLKPLHTGSTSALYTPPMPLQNRNTSPYSNVSMYRSMPSIITDTDTDNIINISSYCIRGAGSRTHYEYDVRICTVDDRWSVLRRYSRFRDLHIAMKARYGDQIGKIPFPSKQLFSNSESVAQSRKKQLQMYLRRLIETCKNHPACPLAKGIFENGKCGTS